MDRTILHCDCNSYFASVELLSHPELRLRPVAVCGDPAARHGVILAKNDVAKRYGVKTAETINDAKRKCPDIVLLKPHHELYGMYCRQINAIYEQYTDLVEKASVDESYLDVTASQALFGSGKQIADELRARVKKETGLTISVGVSFNKIFAKMGSDYKKPDATTVISRDNFKELLYPLPIDDMMYVGKSSAALLKSRGIMTLNDIYNAGEKYLSNLLGKGGESLWRNVAGLDNSPVMPVGHKDAARSVGNSITFRRDLVSESDFNAGLTMLCESVAQRLRAMGMYSRCVTVVIKDTQLHTISRQMRVDTPTNSTDEILSVARTLLKRNWQAGRPARMLSVSASALEESPPQQLSFFDDDERTRERGRKLYSAVDEIRARFGSSALKMGSILSTDIVPDAQGGNDPPDE